MTDFSLSCPLPITERKTVVLGHGAGGKLSAQLLRDLFLPAFDNPILARLDDQAVLDAADAAFAAARPGNRFRDVHTAAMTVIAERLHEWGLLPEGVSVAEVVNTFRPSGNTWFIWFLACEQ